MLPKYYSTSSHLILYKESEFLHHKYWVSHSLASTALPRPNDPPRSYKVTIGAKVTIPIKIQTGRKIAAALVEQSPMLGSPTLLHESI